MATAADRSPREMGVEEARKTLGDLVTGAARTGRVTVLTKGGIPAAAIVPLTLLREVSAAAHGYRGPGGPQHLEETGAAS